MEGDELQVAIQSNLDQIRTREQGTRLGADSEELHGFRVATRRIRSLLHSARPLLAEAGDVKRLRGELKWLAALLGEARDRDVLIEDLVGGPRSLDASHSAAMIGLLDEERAAAHRALVSALDSPRYGLLLESLLRPPALRADESLLTAARTEYEKLCLHVRQLGEHPTDDDLHDARIRVKRARYAAEASGVDGPFVRRTKRLQDVLGEHQDAVVAETKIRTLLDAARDGGRTAYAADRLLERLQDRRAAARTAWPEAWRRLEKAGEKAFA